VSGSPWQSRTAIALLIGAIGEGVLVLLTEYVGGGFVLATFVVSIGLGFAFGPWIGAVGAGFPPLGLIFVSSGDDATIGERILTALTVVLLLGGSAWFTGRVRERFGNPPWGRFEGGSE
jgi:hypothetical protein